MFKPGHQKTLARTADVQELEHKKDVLGDLATRVDETEANLKSSEDQAYFLEDRLSEQMNKFAEKDGHRVVIGSVLLFSKRTCGIHQLYLSALLHSKWSA